MKGVTLFLADGFEDMEALATRDVLLRGQVPVQLIAVKDDYFVESSHALQVTADTSWADLLYQEEGTCAEDVMIFPGGMPGSKNLAEHTELMEIMKKHYELGGTVAAICAAPGLVLSQLGREVLEGKRVTCFDGFEDALIGQGAVFTGAGTETDGRIITGKGAGHAVGFGLAILAYLKGEACAAQVKAGLML